MFVSLLIHCLDMLVCFLADSLSLVIVVLVNITAEEEEEIPKKWLWSWFLSPQT
jgi:hypothetical protein